MPQARARYKVPWHFFSSKSYEISPRLRINLYNFSFNHCKTHECHVCKNLKDRTLLTKTFMSFLKLATQKISHWIFPSVHKTIKPCLHFPLFHTHFMPEAFSSFLPFKKRHKNNPHLWFSMPIFYANYSFSLSLFSLANNLNK